MLIDAVFASPTTDLSDPRLWSDFGFMAPDTASGIRVSPESAMGISAYYCGIRAISEDTAKLPLITYKRRDGRGKDRAPDHPVYSLLHDAPNDDMGSMAFRETLTGHAQGWGGGFAKIIESGRGIPVALEVIHPSRVQEVRESRQLTKVYRVRNDEGPHTDIPQRSMFHLHGIGPDGESGWSVARVGAESLGRAIAAERFGASFFKSGMASTGVIEAPGRIKKNESLDRLRKQWRDTYAGLENHHKPIILEGGAKFTPLSIPPEDAQLLETNQFSVEEVARWLRIAPHKLMHLLHATFSNIEEQNIDYVNDTLMPWMVRWEQEIWRKLFTPADRKIYFTEHLVHGLMRGNAEARSAYYRELFNVGALSQNDIREMENQNPVDGGDTYYINGALIRSEDAAEGKTMATEEPPAGRIDGNDAIPRAEVISRYRASAAPILLEAFERCRTKEVKALRHASKKPEGFAAWAERFYEAHGRYIADAFGEPVAAALNFLRAMGQRVSVRYGVERCQDYADKNCARVLAAHDAGTLPDAIDFISGSAPAIVEAVEKDIFDGTCYVRGAAFRILDGGAAVARERGRGRQRGDVGANEPERDGRPSRAGGDDGRTRLRSRHRHCADCRSSNEGRQLDGRHLDGGGAAGSPAPRGGSGGLGSDAPHRLAGRDGRGDGGAGRGGGPHASLEARPGAHRGYGRLGGVLARDPGGAGDRQRDGPGRLDRGDGRGQ